MQLEVRGWFGLQLEVRRWFAAGGATMVCSSRCKDNLRYEARSLLGMGMRCEDGLRLGICWKWGQTRCEDEDARRCTDGLQLLEMQRWFVTWSLQRIVCSSGCQDGLASTGTATSKGASSSKDESTQETSREESSSQLEVQPRMVCGSEFARNGDEVQRWFAARGARMVCS